MELIKSENYNTHLCNFYEDNHNEVWLTREQVGAALGYADPAKSIQNIHLKHKDRLDKFIKREKVKTTEIHEHHQSDGGRKNGSTKPFSKNDNLQSEVVYYSERGVMEICRWSDMPKADEFMDWVWDIVEAYRRNEIVATQKAIELQEEKFRMLADRVEEIGKLVQDTRQEQLERLDTITARLDILEEKGEVVLDAPTEWAKEMMKHVRKIADTYTRGDTNKCMDRLIERSEEYMCETYETLKADYAAHSNGKKAKKILIMARDEDTREAFERAVKDYEIELGIYEQNEGQKYLEKVMDGFGIEIVNDPHEKAREWTADEWDDFYKFYGGDPYADDKKDNV